jgi:hypothetical protein
MRFGRVLLELFHLLVGLMATKAVFAVAAWAYPPGRDTIEPIGWMTMGAVLAMSLPELRKAWVADRTKKEEELG